MAAIFVTLRDGKTLEVEAHENLSLMEIIRDAGIHEIEALCGGCCSCATCHIYITSGPAEALPAPTQMEQEMLEASEHSAANSRLACQCTFTSAMNGLRIQIARED